MTTESVPESATEDWVIALLQALCNEPVISLAKIGKQMNLRRSQLERLLLLLGENESWGGMGYLTQSEQRGRAVILLTQKGKDLCASMAN
ncbi:hypothetical protein F6A13_06885 [Acidithiobacillus sp. 'AMD consortium']|uniref:Transcriptional regulator n=4 Tax=Acidithiobacillus TaxID=119977 RepID=B7JAZ2_ACIF2|nr:MULTISPECIES: hypothetical protein [Acidithiobacillus]EGQ64058.1 hypothetical protein GGI1_23201 [Acidithiobacillus sp. GGI-221]MBN6747432.1 hypothetical protein [Acidithiobacillus sp. PG05]MBU2807319.1 hypothetical protein [Acidithiobacillus ferrooxidans F221]ACH83584.1 hypothetical protein Lferr_1351 [Acidithiobacillus ferrooxidans ATCC 53993]ACK79772.1 hypothetical protein AFE_1653 [Acidithiobacillus ferrooxidans ATCC 23270]